MKNAHFLKTPRLSRAVLCGALLVGAAALSACSSMSSAAGASSRTQPAMGADSMTSASLYVRLGGKPAITAVVDDFISNVAADSRINARFASANIPRLKTLLVEQICAGSGGPCTYTGRDMATAHQGMGIRGDEFDALVGDLVKSLDKYQVPEREKNDLLALLGPSKSAIVAR
jgi:hemoglobin